MEVNAVLQHTTPSSTVCDAGSSYFNMQQKKTNLGSNDSADSKLAHTGSDVTKCEEMDIPVNQEYKSIDKDEIIIINQTSGNIQRQQENKVTGCMDAVEPQDHAPEYIVYAPAEKEDKFGKTTRRDVRPNTREG